VTAVGPVVRRPAPGPRGGGAPDRLRTSTGPSTFPRALRLLFVALVLYAAFGKGFAYAGWPPVFVGEVVLVVVVAAALARPPVAVPRSGAALVAVGLAGVATVQFAVDRFAGEQPLLETVRGLTPIYYAAYAFAVFALLRHAEGRVGRRRVLVAVERAATRAAPFVTVAAAVLALLLVGTPVGIPTWPRSQVPLLLTKSTDIAVSLVIVLPLLAAPHVARRSATARRLLLACWSVAAVLIVFRSRGAAVALALGWFAIRPRPRRIVRPLMVVTLVLAALYLTGWSVTVGGRELSAQGAADAAASLLGAPTDDEVSGNYLDTRNWRSDWWGAIWRDVTTEDMVLHGHGWGDNLAVRHDVVPPGAAADPRVLRLPHNVFFSLAGRAGLLVAIGFLLVPALTVARSFRNGAAGRSELVGAARGGVVAAVVVAFTDIFLESPQGGILLWSLLGFLWWATARPLARPAGGG